MSGTNSREGASRHHNSCVPHVNELAPAELERLLVMAVLAQVAEVGGALAGALIVLGPRADYGSRNYQWFSARYDDFLYVDRVLVANPQRRSGVGARLYGELFKLARDKGRRILCEVNLEPPNPGSLAFHHGLGFQEVGRLRHPDTGKAVAMLERPTNPPLRRETVP